jgi:excisionase family DNA binding protein
MSELPNKELLRPGEVARYLSISVKTIYGWIAVGKLKAVKVGPYGLLRIERKEVLNMTKPAIE